MKYVLLILLCASCFAMNINARQSSKDICFEANKLNSNMSKDKVYVFGEVFQPQSINFETDKTTLSKVIAMSGGFTKRSFIQKVQVIQCSFDFSSVQDKLLINFREIKEGNKIDPILNGGELIYVPRSSESNFDKRLQIPSFVSEPNRHIISKFQKL
jgi:protein involved in polysaccharide export with SLBB domain